MENVQEVIENHPVSRVNSFLKTIVIHLVIDDTRKHGQMPEVVSLDSARGDGDGASPVDTIPDTETDVEGEALAHDERTALRKIVHQALAQLSQQQQEIIRLTFTSEPELSDKEIADILRGQYPKVTANTVRNQRSRAKETLRKYFQSLRANNADVDQLLSDFLSRRRDA